MSSVIATLREPGRITSVDVFRGIAITTVVFFHFGKLPYGYLGVDLFFVVSGLLVSRALIGDLEKERPISFWRFVVTRGIKIWPSYYALLLLGNLIAFALYRNTHPKEIITLAHFPRYALFFQNYRGTAHWSFDHVWSLCVEEHFYILLPILFLVVERAGRKKSAAIALVLACIFAGIAFKAIGYRVGFETHSATHNRIDALAWGVLLSLLQKTIPDRVRALTRTPALFLLGLAIFVGSLWADVDGRFPRFNAVGFHSLVPFSFFLMLLNAYHWPFRGSLPIRFVAYYSYNWYLWHLLFVLAIQDAVGTGWLGLSVFVLVSFGAGVLFTKIVEEPMMNRRAAILKRLFASSGSNSGGSSLRSE